MIKPQAEFVARAINASNPPIFLLFLHLHLNKMLAIRLPRILQAKQNLLRGSSLARDVRKGYIAVYVGEEEKKRFVIPLSYLNQSSFQELLSKAEEEFGFDHPMGGLTIPCREDIFLDLTSHINSNTMTRHLPAILAKRILRRSVSNASKPASKCLDVPKGFLAVYIGVIKKKRFVVPVSYLNEPSFQDLLNEAEEEFGFNHPMGGLTIPCREDKFSDTNTDHRMAILLKGIMNAKQILRRSSLHANHATEVPKGYFAVYVGESQKKRFTLPISFLNQPSFQELLRKAEEEFGFIHPMGATEVPKGYFAVYVGESQKKRFTLPISFLNQPSFQELLRKAEEEFGFNHPMGDHRMAILLKGIMNAKQILRRSSLHANHATEVPKGYFAVYAGESQKKRFTLPISFLNQPSFQELLRKAEEEFRFNHPMGGLTLPCREDTFIDIISGLNSS
ncbi:hypothetical protein SADUNF_Sadunf04G0118300 [Salix dunnii]|uniref:Small auxin up regulated protein n=1 Tax=Salix dunnii TaxID=1413687 RepID=A0A835K9H0_9ROSI|nr:hypothetical protein SADUNF_Sadunf04G0118300 [Salix dunnii]